MMRRWWWCSLRAAPDCGEGERVAVVERETTSGVPAVLQELLLLLYVVVQWLFGCGSQSLCRNETQAKTS